ncbi:MAG: PKD domain-containing protein [Cyclobacteriaceae bacterium]
MKKINVFCLSIVMSLITGVAFSQHEVPLEPLLRTVDMNRGEILQVELHDGSTAEVELVKVEPTFDTVFDAVREVKVTVRVNGMEQVVLSGNYHLPVTVGEVQIDCPVTQDYMKRASSDWWALEKDVRLRLWPAGSPLIWPGSLVYPVNQKWMASFTQFSNEPVVGGPRNDGKIYYHAGLDFGGAEDMVEVFAATDGVVVSVRGDVLSGEPDNPIKPRYDVVYLRDARGWYYRYSHFDSIDPDLQVGQTVLAGQKLGMLGKEGGSGGWTHLHFEAHSKQPSGKWGTQEGYAFLWQAYLRQFDPHVLAVARPHKVIRVGKKIFLSAANSWIKNGDGSYDWTLSDGSSDTGEEIEKIYDQPGTYSEIVKVSDAEGHYDYDFAVVKVYEKESKGEEAIPDIHATYYPTKDIKEGDKVFFQVRTRWETEGYDVWDFKDGSEKVKVKSNIETENHSKVGYSVISHRFEQPGDYLVKVNRTINGITSTAHLYVKVEAWDK